MVERPTVKNTNNCGVARIENVLHHEPLIQISFHVPRTYAEKLDELVSQGVYPSRSEAVRDAIAQLLTRVKSQVQLLPPQIQQTQQQGSGELVRATVRVVRAVTGSEDDYGDAVIIKCAACGYEMLKLTDHRVARLIKVFKTYHAKCPRCGSHELFIQYVRTRKKQKQRQR